MPCFFGRMTGLCLRGSQSITTECPFLHRCSQISSHGVLRQCPQRKRRWMKWSYGIFTHTYNRRRDLWSTVDGIFPAPKCGSRFGISHGRVEELSKYLRFAPQRNFQMEMTSGHLFAALQQVTSCKILSIMEHLCR